MTDSKQSGMIWQLGGLSGEQAVNDTIYPWVSCGYRVIDNQVEWYEEKIYPTVLLVETGVVA